MLAAMCKKGPTIAEQRFYDPQGGTKSDRCMGLR